MNPYTHDQISLMSREESRELEEQHKLDEYQASLIECACGGKFEPWQITQIGGVNHCPACVEIWKEQNQEPEDSAAETMLAVISPERLEKLKWSVALMNEKIGGGDPDLVWWAKRVEGAMKVKQTAPY